MYHFRSNLYFPCLLFFDKFFSIVVDVSQATFAAILTIEMGSHEDTSSTFFCGAFSSRAMDFSIVINSVVCKGCNIYLLMNVFYCLWGDVILLLSFFGTTTKTQDQV